MEATTLRRLQQSLKSKTDEQFGYIVHNIRKQNILQQTQWTSDMLESVIHVLDSFFSQREEAKLCTRLCWMYPSDENVVEVYQHWKYIIKQLYDHAIKFNLIAVTPPNKDSDEHLTELELRQCKLKETLVKLSNSVKMSFDIINYLRLINVKDHNILAAVIDVNPVFQEFLDDPSTRSKTKPHQSLLTWYYEQTYKRRYRRLEGALYKPRFNANGIFLHSYSYECDIEQFVWDAIDASMPKYSYYFSLLTQSMQTPKFIQTVLTNANTIFLPKLKRLDDIHAFENGVYSLTHRQFYVFQDCQFDGESLSIDHITSKTSDKVIALRFHEMVARPCVINYKALASDVHTNIPAPFSDPCGVTAAIPNIAKILIDQGFDYIERFFIFGLLGRLLYPVGKLDNWSVFVFFIGLAGTGKSTLLQIIAAVFDPGDVGYLSNNIQKKFGLEAIYNKKLFLALDIDDKFNLDQTTFQSVVSGEEVSIQRKNKTALSLKWTVPGAFAGNKLPSWTDNAGSLSRRLITVEYLRPLTKIDTGLKGRCMDELDRFIQAINQCYRHLVDKYAHVALKSVLPRKFLESQRRAEIALSPLMAFAKDKCIFSEDEIITKVDFLRAFKGYCAENDISYATIPTATMINVLSKLRIILCNPKTRDARGMSEAYLLHVAFKN